ncbi:hypothetical protein, partial [Cedecea sp. NFIX57]|uniref:hypothetical protein n=1 Tax=Cedecea sp. NFIX57 TaxID=1566286 RepID=UPI001C390DD9
MKIYINHSRKERLRFPLSHNVASGFTLTLTLSLKGRAAVFKVKGGAMSSPILYYPEALHSGWSPA